MTETSANGSVNCEEKTTDESDKNHEKWALPLKVIYQLALKFFKEMEGKVVNLSYEDKIKLVAYSKQVAFGKCNEEILPQLGVLDVIGKNRRLAWKELVDMPAEEAMSNFIDLLDLKCFLFKTFIEAHVAQKQEEFRLAQEKIKKEEKLKSELVNGNDVTKETSIEEKKKRMIQDALNQQTYAQFRAYAEDQFPGNPEQQAVLVRQLQDQHYLQYMQQILHQHETQASTEHKSVNDVIAESGIVQTHEEEISEISPANMWTLNNIKSFKDHIRKEGGDAIIKIGHGETVTVRVPTHEGGSCLYWEFCTDHYDLGFGIYFEWNKSPTNQVSVHVSETDDEVVTDEAAYDDDDDEEDNSELEYDDDYELADDDTDDAQHFPKESTSHRHSNSTRKTTKIMNRSPLSIISPIMRRDCHQEVYAGSHGYPGEGVYLLKFDNSYSLWRSKTLYYRVYYTR